MEQRVLDRPVMSLALAEEIARVRAGPQWAASGKTAITLAKNDRLRVVLAVLARGRSLEEHSAEGPLTVYVAEGTIRFVTPEDKIELSAGAMLVLRAGVQHSVDALEDSAFVITLAR
jgi:quercetin dioxygenase-like cupin family protein